MLTKVYWQHRFAWLSLVIHPYQPLNFVGPLNSTSVHTKLMNKFCWLTNTGVCMFRSQLENVTYEFVLISSAVKKGQNYFHAWSLSEKNPASKEKYPYIGLQHLSLLKKYLLGTLNT